MEIQKTWSVLLLIIVLCIGCSKNPEQQIAEQLEWGRKYLLEENYEQAIITFDKIIEMEPKCWGAYKGIAEIYRQQNDYEKAVSSLESGITIIGKRNIPNDDMTMLVEWYQHLAVEASYLGMENIALKYYGKILELDPTDLSAQEKKEQKEGIIQYELELKNMALAVASQKRYNFQDDIILSDKFQALIKKLNEPMYFHIKDKQYIGVYPGGYIYYGEMENGIREGTGFWYFGDIKRLERVQGSWSNNLPNGVAVIETFINPEKIQRKENKTYALYVVEKTNLVNGIYEGNTEIRWDMEGAGCNHEWLVAYSGGMLQEIDNGGNAAFCVNCGANLLASDFVKKIEGIEP